MRESASKITSHASIAFKQRIITLSSKQSEQLNKYFFTYYNKYKEYTAELHKRYNAQANSTFNKSGTSFTIDSSQIITQDSKQNSAAAEASNAIADKKAQLLAIEDQETSLDKTMSFSSATSSRLSSSSDHGTQFPDPDIAVQESTLLAIELEESRWPVASKIDQLLKLGSDPQWIQEYVNKVNADAKDMFGERVKATRDDSRDMEKTDLLNTQQVHQIMSFLELHKNQIADWFANREESRLLDTSEEMRSATIPTDIFRIGAKAEQRLPQFQAGDLPRSIELHKEGDQLRIYITPSKKLASGSKADKLARGGMDKKVTNMIWLNPTNLKQRLLDMVTKSQSAEVDVETELELEKKAYGSDTAVIGQEYLSKQEVKIRTSEPAAVCDMSSFFLDQSSFDRFITLDERYDPNNRDASIDTIKESLLADCLICLEKIHAADIVHKDIKPENILIIVRDGRLCAKVTDFGLAEDMSNGDTELCGTSGTLPYYSPQHVLMQWCMHQKIIPTESTDEALAQDAEYLNKANFYGKVVASKWMSGTQDKTLNLYGSHPADDMWAFGITMFRFLAKRDPTNMSIDDAAKEYPLIKKHEELLKQIFSFERDKRPDAKAALAMLKLPPTHKQELHGR